MRRVVSRVKYLIGRPLEFRDLEKVVTRDEAEEHFCQAVDGYINELGWSEREAVTVKEILGARVKLNGAEIRDLSVLLTRKIRGNTNLNLKMKKLGTS
jgi:hypothetical protein